MYKLPGRGLDDFEELAEDESFRSVGCQTVLNSRHLLLNVLGTSCSITESDFEFQVFISYFYNIIYYRMI